MHYKFIFIFACVILHTNGYKFGFGGGGGGSRSFISTPVRSSSSTPARSFNSFSNNPSRSFNSISSNPPRPIFGSLSVPQPRPLNSISSIPSRPITSSQTFGNLPSARSLPPPLQRSSNPSQTFGNPPLSSNTGKLAPVTSNNPNFGFLRGLPRNNLDKKIGNTGSTVASKPNVQSIDFKNPTSDSKSTSVTSNNPDFGFLKGMPRNNLEKKIDSSSSTDSKKLNTGIMPDAQSIGFKNPSNIPVNGKLNPVPSNNPEFGFLKGMPRNNLDNKFKNPPLPGNVKSNAGRVLDSTTNSNIGGISKSLSTDLRVNHGSQQPEFTKSHNGMDSIPNNNIGKITKTLSTDFKDNHGSQELKFSRSSSHDGLKALSTLNALHKSNTGHNLSRHLNVTHFHNSTNNLKQTNKTIDILLKDLEAVRKNFTDVKLHLNTTNSQAKQDVSWVQKQLDHGVDQLHQINSTENRNTNYTKLLSLMNNKLLNLSDFVKLMNSTNYIGHKNYTNHFEAGSLSDFKNYLQPRIKKAYSNSARRHTDILKSQEHVSDYNPKYSNANNHAESQMIIAVSLIISLLIVI